MSRMQMKAGTLVFLALAFVTVALAPAGAQQVFNNDIVVRSSACVGIDCPNSPAFGFDTIRLQENNLRINFEDTSSAGAFPSNDWQLVANDSTNGGANKFSILDDTAGRFVFTVEAGAPENALYVDDGGRIGMGTSVPVVEAHMADGDTPALRLEQDGSSGFTPQVWDVAGNETNFFVRDVSNGSQLPFKIRPGADTDSLVIDSDNDLGVGILSPAAPLHVIRSGAAQTAQVLVEDTGGSGEETLFRLVNNGAVSFNLEDAAGGNEWKYTVLGSGAFQITKVGSGAAEFLLDATGNLTLRGNCGTGGVAGSGCDAVFQPGYEIESIEEHAEFMWENSHLPAVGPTPEGKAVPLNIQQRHFGVLNELEKAHIYIEWLNERLKEKDSQIAKIEQRNAELARRLARLEGLLIGQERAD